MSRRDQSTEPAFGSDSFMDVIANIVGILIILVVIAGLRVSQHAKDVRQQVQLTASIPAPAPPVEPVPEPLVPLPELETPLELVEATSSLKQNLVDLESASQKASLQLQMVHQRQDQLLQQLKSVQKMLDEKREETTAAADYVKLERIDLEKAREQLRELQKQLKETEARTPQAKQIEHRITPISRVVNGKEKHFRIANNRVAEIPLDELIGLIKSQMERRKDFIARSKSYQGQVGPIRGFSMKFQIQRESASPSDELRMGQGVFKIVVSQWELVPEPNFEGESAAEALRSGSRFHQTLIDADQDATITFWVYPESFGTYRKLQSFAHAQNFSVAARPLPKDYPISGSPQGTKSAGQ